MTPPYLAELASFAVETPGTVIPGAVCERARQMIADTVGCMLAGSRADPVRRLAQSVLARGGVREAVPPGHRMRLPVEQAAWLGGIAGTWHDLDEGNLHTRTHAAVQIVPVLCAEAQRRGLSGVEFLHAFVLAYEVVSRLWRAARIRLAVHPHGTTGALAGALALARVRGFDVPRTVAVMNAAMALGVASSRHTLNDGATVRNVYTGSGARAAFEAIALVEAGFSGEVDAPASVLGAIYGDAFDPGAAMSALGARWWTSTSYFKRFASARYVHGPLDLLEDLAAGASCALRADDIERIDVDTYFMAATMGQQSVNSAFGMRFSIPAAMAARIVCGPAPLTDEPTGAFDDPRVHQLAKRIFVREDESATARYPSLQPSRVRISYRDGRRHELAADRIIGEGDCPLPAGALRAKFMELSAPTLGEHDASQTWSTLLDLDAVKNLGNLLAGWSELPRAPARPDTTET